MRYKAIVMYDGTNFHGFQSQENLRTVQQEIEDVLKIVCKKETKIYPAGRTDTGVHAYGQVFHFDYDVEMKEWQIKNAINSRLSKDIYIKNINIINDNFHARFHAVKKRYQYVINLNEFNPLNKNYCYYYKYKLDTSKMIEASKIFIGEHDFKSFTKNHKLENTVRTIYDINFDIKDNVIKINFSGNGFLYNMVRIIVAMLIEVGNERITIEKLKQAMDNKDRKFAPKLAPANGLYLMEVYYE